MALIVKPVLSIKERVVIQEPIGLGKTKRSDIVVEFKKLPVSETKALLESSQSGEANDDDVLIDNIINIEGLLDEEKNKIPYDTTVLMQLLEMEYVRKPLVQKFMEILVGREALKAKN